MAKIARDFIKYYCTGVKRRYDNYGSMRERVKRMGSCVRAERKCYFLFWIFTISFLFFVNRRTIPVREKEIH